ncbi:MAG: hypothetical protein WD739_11565 [Actinomycetota bacterium]
MLDADEEALARAQASVAGISEEDVRNHEVTWSSDWPSFLDKSELEDLSPTYARLAGSLRGTIKRGDVFDIANGVELGEWSGRELLLATFLWGFGNASANRRATIVPKALARENDGVISRLFERARTSTGTDAARALHRGDRDHVPELGIAFGSKFLYFAGFESGGPVPRPLILDEKVAAFLGRKPDVGWYGEYLELMYRWAQTPGWRVSRVDAIEMAMFLSQQNR